MFNATRMKVALALDYEDGLQRSERWRKTLED